MSKRTENITVELHPEEGKMVLRLNDTFISTYQFNEDDNADADEIAEALRALFGDIPFWIGEQWTVALRDHFFSNEEDI